MPNDERELAEAQTREAIDKATSVMKQAKEEILSTAWKQAPTAEEVERFDMIDQFIRHYLIKHFNAQAYTWLKATPEEAVFTIHCLAEGSKEGAKISQDEVKNILDKCAKAPAP